MDRIKWVDNLKGFILLLVCIEHVHFHEGLMQDITSLSAAFKIPSFFFLSGFLFSIRRYPLFSSYLKSKAKTLLLPYVSMSIFFSILDIRLYDVSLIDYYHYPYFPILEYFGVPETIQNSFQYIYLVFVNIFISGTSSPVTLPLWFVNVLFWTSICFYLISSLTPPNSIRRLVSILLYAVIALCAGWVCNIYHYYFPYNFQSVFTASFYFSMGYLAKDIINKKLYLMNTKYLICLIIVIIPLYFYGINVNGAIALYANSLGGDLLGLIISTVSGVSLIVMAFILLSRIPCTSFFGGFFRNLARNALVFLAVHYWVIVTCGIVFQDYNKTASYKYLVLVVALLISFLAFPIFRNKLYWLLGKEKISVKDSLSFE